MCNFGDWEAGCAECGNWLISLSAIAASKQVTVVRGAFGVHAPARPVYVSRFLPLFLAADFLCPRLLAATSSVMFGLIRSCDLHVLFSPKPHSLHTGQKL